MKREKLLSCLCGWILSFLISFSGLACMVTGLGLSAELPAVALGCGLISAVASVCFYFKWGGVDYLGLSLVALLILVFQTDFLTDAADMVAAIAVYYERAYHFGITMTPSEAGYVSHLMPLLVIGWLVATLCAQTVCQAKGAILATLISILPLASCMVVTDTVPDTFWLFLFLLSMSLLIITQVLRRRAPSQAPRLTATLAAPLAAVLALLFLLIPPDSYSPSQTGDLLSQMQTWLQSVTPYLEETAEGELVFGLSGAVAEQVPLDAQGNRSSKDTPVMEITASYSGTVYLRGRSYAEYDGLTWLSSEDLEEGFGLSDEWTGSTGSVTVRTYGSKSLLYLPYYPSGGRTLTDGMLKNEDRTSEYTVTVDRLAANLDAYTWDRYPVQGDGPNDIYTELPGQTRKEAEAIVQKLLLPVLSSSAHPVAALSDTFVARLIANHVRSSAEYDLNPGKMPKGEEDFVLWFLEDSDKGYCVHFASAAVVLLRAAGIPARYVEGYKVSAEAGETVVVRDNMAHAWAEYYVDGLGWVVLEATPADEEAPVTDPTAGPTEPVTEPTELPTVPTEPTAAPTEPTDPTAGPTEPTAAPTSQSTGPTGESTEPPPAPEEPPEEDSAAWLWWLLGILGILALSALLILVRWALWLRHISRTLHRGSRNARALAYWQELTRLCRLLKQQPPEELRSLAEKAKFSQHTVTDEELARLIDARQALIRQVKALPLPRRLVFRLICAAY